MLVTMNDKEILRLNAIRDVCDKRIRRADFTCRCSTSARSRRSFFKRAIALAYELLVFN